MKPLHNPDVDALFEAILAMKTVEECYAFFEDACTIKEILDVSQRLKAAKMLSSGANYADISRETGMSTATISRVSKCLEYGAGGYRLAIERVGAGTASDQE
jgi:TrpR-related protein YerC/YecD